jgi:hypothetical protein
MCFKPCDKHADLFLGPAAKRTFIHF